MPTTSTLSPGSAESGCGEIAGVATVNDVVATPPVAPVAVMVAAPGDAASGTPRDTEIAPVSSAVVDPHAAPWKSSAMVSDGAKWVPVTVTAAPAAPRLGSAVMVGWSNVRSCSGPLTHWPLSEPKPLSTRKSAFPSPL